MSEYRGCKPVWTNNSAVLDDRVGQRNFFVTLPSCAEDHSCLLSLESLVSCWGPLPSSQSWHFRYQVVFAALLLLQASHPASQAGGFPIAAFLLWWGVVLNFYTQDRNVRLRMLKSCKRVAVAGYRWGSPSSEVESKVDLCSSPCSTSRILLSPNHVVPSAGKCSQIYLFSFK